MLEGQRTSPTTQLGKKKLVKDRPTRQVVVVFEDQLTVAPILVERLMLVN
jgi:hypothetical protein